MAACTFCSAGEESRRFLVQAQTSARICDQCLCEYTRLMFRGRGLEQPGGLARLGIATWKSRPFERGLQRFKYLLVRGELDVPRLVARAIERRLARLEPKPERPVSPLSVYFTRPPVRPLEKLERVCSFCGVRRRFMLGGRSGGRICETCIEHASRTLLG